MEIDLLQNHGDIDVAVVFLQTNMDLGIQNFFFGKSVITLLPRSYSLLTRLKLYEEQEMQTKKDWNGTSDFPSMKERWLAFWRLYRSSQHQCMFHAFDFHTLLAGDPVMEDFYYLAEYGHRNYPRHDPIRVARSYINVGQYQLARETLERARRERMERQRAEVALLFKLV